MNLKSNSTIKAAILLALVIVGSYYPIIFLNQSYNTSFPISPYYLDYEGKPWDFKSTIDHGADSIQIWPVLKLSAELYSEGKIPLWNPYLGLGHPISADNNHYVFSPLILGFLLPISLWDVPLLVALWIAGFTMFLFLRSLGLNFPSSIAGGIFYMLSGAFTWYLPHVHVAVMMFTPLILYSVEKIIQNKNPKYIALAGVSVSLGILGAHLESIIFQLLFIGLYAFYRIFSIKLLNHKVRNNNTKEIESQLETYNTKRILIWFIFAFLVGIGLSAFYTLPAYELVDNAQLIHGNNWGLKSQLLIYIPTIFMPYVDGTLHTNWGWDDPVGQFWYDQWGYVGVFPLLFSILGLYLSLKNKTHSFHKFTPLFFLAVSSFFIMKTVGVPVVNWIGYLPIFDLMNFLRHSGVIIPFGFAASAAFGINFLDKTKISKKTFGIVCIITIFIIILSLIPVFVAMSSLVDSEITSSNPDLIFQNTGFQIIQVCLFTLMAFLFGISISKNKSAIVGLISIIFLELSVYIPFGVPDEFIFQKYLIALLGMLAITFLTLKPNPISWTLNSEKKKVKLYVIVIILGVTLFGQAMILLQSPYGLPEKFDSYQNNPMTDFLKNNLNNYRIFSFESTLGTNYPAAYKIGTLGLLTAEMKDSVWSFKTRILQDTGFGTSIGWPPWHHQYGQVGSIEKFNENKNYFNFLGIKYIITEGYELNNLSTVFKFHNLFIQENPDVFPRSFLVKDVTLVDYDLANDFLLENPNFDLRNNVILEKPIKNEILVTLESSQLDKKSESEIISYSENNVIIKVQSNDASLLILTDTHYPGWKAYVDGTETEIYRADGLVRAVFVPTGNHTVEFSYLPDSFVNGVIISLVTGGVLLSLFVYSNKRN